jgi:hypothetical protein
MADLTPFGDRDVLQASIAVTQAGDGLSKALGVKPCEYAIGDRVFVVLQTVVSKVGYDELKESDCLRRVHTLRTELGTIVDEKLVRRVLDAQQKAIDEAKGQGVLDIDDPDGDED